MLAIGRLLETQFCWKAAGNVLIDSGWNNSIGTTLLEQSYWKAPAGKQLLECSLLESYWKVHSAGKLLGTFCWTVAGSILLKTTLLEQSYW